MLNNISDIKNEFLVRNQSSTAAAFYTDEILNDWLKQAHTFSAGYHKWPLTEGRVSTTYASTEEWSFEGYKPDSFRIITVGGKRLSKLNFEDYLIFREESPSDDDRVYSDFGNLVYVNPNADVSGTLVAYGQYVPAELDTSVPTTLTVFSNREEEGNEAMVNLMLCYARTREKKLTEADYYKTKAIEILEGIYKRFLDEQGMYQTHPDRGGMFKRLDVLEGSMSEEIRKRDQF